MKRYSNKEADYKLIKEPIRYRPVITCSSTRSLPNQRAYDQYGRFIGWKTNGR